jgi:hypothetical protein
MFIGSTDNLILDGQCADISYWVSSTGGTITKTASGGSWGVSQYYLSLPVVGGSPTDILSPLFAVEAGLSYFCSGVTAVDASNGQDNGIGISFFDANGDFISGAIVGVGTASATPRKYSSAIVAPSGASSAQLYSYAENGATGNVYLASPIVRLMANGDLIVDGNIQARHMDVDSVTAGAIAAGAINATDIIVDDIIVTGHLVTKAVTETETATWSNASTTWTSSVGFTWGDVTPGSITITSDGSPMLIASSVQFNITVNEGKLPEAYIKVSRGDGKVIGYILLPPSGWLSTGGFNYTQTLSIMAVDIASAGSTTYTLVLGGAADAESGTLTNTITAIAPNLTAWYWKK